MGKILSGQVCLFKPYHMEVPVLQSPVISCGRYPISQNPPGFVSSSAVLPILEPQSAICGDQIWLVSYGW